MEKEIKEQLQKIAKNRGEEYFEDLINSLQAEIKEIKTKIIVKNIKVKNKAYSERCNHTKAFVSIDNKEKYFGKDPGYLDSNATDEEKEQNNKEWKKYNREEIKTMRIHLKDILAKNNIEYEKLSFSRKAGCSCGCSPGFIIEGTHHPMIIWVDLEAVEV